MQVYEAPGHVPDPCKLFLAGGITNCPDWQADAIDALSHIDELIVFNPRRENFPMDDSEAAGQQILWEHQMLRRADVISFWFPKETLCPITLYELGVWTQHEGVEIVVGCDPEYQRLQDVEIQTELSRPEIPVVTEWHRFIMEIEGCIP